MTERILTVAQTAELLQVNYETCRDWIKRGMLPGRKIGRVWRILESDLRDFISRGDRPQAQE